MTSVYTIFEFNSGGKPGDPENPLYLNRGYWAGKSAKDALSRFLWETLKELPGRDVTDAQGVERTYFFTARNRVGSFGKGQFWAQKTGLVPVGEAN